ncbi:MAG: hypothetical protein ABW154_13320 [Dyella sp.]
MNHPTVTVLNNASRDIFIDHDPNWDDQVLKVDGRPIHQAYTLNPGVAAKVSVDWNGAGEELMIGVIFSDKTDESDGYQLSIGQAPSTGELDVTDGDGQGRVKYTVKDQAPWSMTMDFVDA